MSESTLEKQMETKRGKDQLRRRAFLGYDPRTVAKQRDSTVSRGDWNIAAD